VEILIDAAVARDNIDDLEAIIDIAEKEYVIPEGKTSQIGMKLRACSPHYDRQLRQLATSRPDVEVNFTATATLPLSRAM
jgi:hypothetical protein